MFEGWKLWTCFSYCDQMRCYWNWYSQTWMTLLWSFGGPLLADWGLRPNVNAFKGWVTSISMQVFDAWPFFSFVLPRLLIEDVIWEIQSTHGFMIYFFLKTLALKWKINKIMSLIPGVENGFVGEAKMPSFISSLWRFCFPKECDVSHVVTPMVTWNVSLFASRMKNHVERVC